MLLCLLLFFQNAMAQPDKAILDYVQTCSDIQEGGSNIYAYHDVTYVISVVPVIVGVKNEQDCKKVGTTKAKKELLSFIKGSDITSYTELKTSETINETLEGTRVFAQQQFVEYIKEEVIGTINQTVPLGGWYSEDRSVYYFAIFKIIE